MLQNYSSYSISSLWYENKFIISIQFRKYPLMGKANIGHSSSSKQNVLNRPVIFETIRESMEFHHQNNR